MQIQSIVCSRSTNNLEANRLQCVGKVVSVIADDRQTVTYKLVFPLRHHLTPEAKFSATLFTKFIHSEREKRDRIKLQIQCKLEQCVRVGVVVQGKRRILQSTKVYRLNSRSFTSTLSICGSNLRRQLSKESMFMSLCFNQYLFRIYRPVNPNQFNVYHPITLLLLFSRVGRLKSSWQALISYSFNSYSHNFNSIRINYE